ncbi:XRE family transcriptional regulator protein (plasmid) [Rhizobium etli bv. mimosae str. IE4771]|uniref:XRE family transcriptional regulator protein n=1 Tax=Rhizobium etli bv. mimosae str. IE4771 TaxID=1432050 RepID=A0A060I8W4_RHIET|nr:helix-turn-helix transcriptional regulator [Rhizobium sp. IE4771]AIC30109.1 XRE family transcriptional regulator protein [Rhizobium sp. IE4771]
MDLKEVMATNLRRIRHGKQLTQEELAHRTGLSMRHIGAIERAEMSATVTVLGQISEALGVEPAELVTKSRSRG